MSRQVLIIVTAHLRLQMSMAAPLKTVAARATAMSMTEAIVTSLATVPGTGMAMATTAMAQVAAEVVGEAAKPSHP
jgi:hypothetical protein